MTPTCCMLDLLVYLLFGGASGWSSNGIPRGVGIKQSIERIDGKLIWLIHPSVFWNMFHILSWVKRTESFVRYNFIILNPSPWQYVPPEVLCELNIYIHIVGYSRMTC